MSTEHQQYSTENQADKILDYAAHHGFEIVPGLVNALDGGHTESNRQHMRREMTPLGPTGIPESVGV